MGRMFELFCREREKKKTLFRLISNAFPIFQGEMATAKQKRNEEDDVKTRGVRIQQSDLLHVRTGCLNSGRV